MAAGDIHALLSLYDPEVVFLNQSGEIINGVEAQRQELAPFASARAIFEYDIEVVIKSRDIALMHARWKVSSPAKMLLHAIEVARRQPDATWRWPIGDPFNVGKQSEAAG
jgi:ketosteroid isomerase-like protein